MNETADAPPRPRILMICVNRRFRMDEPSCAGRGSEDLADRLEAAILERGLDIKLERSVCMGHCRTGPTIRLAPGGRFYHGPDPQEVEALVAEVEALCGTRSGDDGPPAHLLGS